MCIVLILYPRPSYDSLWVHWWRLGKIQLLLPLQNRVNYLTYRKHSCEHLCSYLMRGGVIKQMDVYYGFWHEDEVSKVS